MECGNCLILSGGWFDKVCTYNNLLLIRKICPTSQVEYCVKEIDFVEVGFKFCLKSYNINTFIIFFLIFSVSSQLRSLKIIKPYPVSVLEVMFPTLNKVYIPTSLHISTSSYSHIKTAIGSSATTITLFHSKIKNKKMAQLFHILHGGLRNQQNKPLSLIVFLGYWNTSKGFFCVSILIFTYPDLKKLLNKTSVETITSFL